jgi:hypothetical protein
LLQPSARPETIEPNVVVERPLFRNLAVVRTIEEVAAAKAARKKAKKSARHVKRMARTSEADNGPYTK